VVQQINKEWDVNKDTTDAYVTEIRKLENKFSGLEIHHVIQDNNVGVDVLSKLGSDRANIPPGVFVHELHHPSIKTPDPSTIAQGPTGTRPRGLDDRGRLAGHIYGLHPGAQTTPSVDPKSAEAIRILRRSKGYVLVGDNLHKRGLVSGILMKCVRMEEDREIL
jgi:hypothetical protein